MARSLVDTHLDPKGRPLQGTEARPGAWRLVVDRDPRCWWCGKLLWKGTLARPWTGQCPRCQNTNCSGEPPAVVE